MFPQNLTLDQTLKAIEGHKEFFVSDNEEYISIDYHYVEQDSFDNPIRKECRGIKFKPNGELLARPYHKFFNYGEKPESTKVDWGKPHQVFDKLDGSMVHGALLDGKVVLMTRKGRTDVAIQAEQYLTSNIRSFIAGYIRLGLTPIFEYIGPDNRIVLFYPQPKLILTALRWNKGGEYAPLSGQYIWPGVTPVCQLDLPVMNFLHEFIRTQKGTEGVVVRWQDGTMLKIKTDEYVGLHRAKEAISDERKVVAVCLQGTVDDLIPLLSQNEADYVKSIQSNVNKLIGEQVDLLMHFAKFKQWAAGWDSTRKDYALEVYKKGALPANLRPAAFKLYDNSNLLPIELVKESLLSLTTNNNKFKELKEMLNG